MAKTLESSFWKVDKRIFEQKLRKLIHRSKDFSPAFHTIAESFRQSRKTIFALGSAGGYPDFKTPESKQAKYNAVRFYYPLLFRYGQLRDSVVNTGNPYNINIIKKKSFALGTSIPYAKYHNSNKKPRKKIPQRKFIFWGAEARKFQNLTEETRTFRGRAIKTLENYIKRDL